MQQAQDEVSSKSHLINVLRTLDTIAEPTLDAFFPDHRSLERVQPHGASQRQDSAILEPSPEQSSRRHRRFVSDGEGSGCIGRRVGRWVPGVLNLRHSPFPDTTRGAHPKYRSSLRVFKLILVKIHETFEVVGQQVVLLVLEVLHNG